MPRILPLLHTLSLIVTLVTGALPLGAADDAPFAPKLNERQLFLDDADVAKIENLTATMHRPEKRGALLRSPDPKQTLQTRTAPVWNPDTKQYLLWTLGTDTSLWQSGDGLNWQPAARNPNLRIDMAVYDPRDPLAARRFKAPILNGGFAVSPDGFEWTKLDLPPVPSSDEGNFSYDPDEGLFLHTIKRKGPHGRSVAIATSRDFATWTDLGVVFGADDEDQARGGRNIEARAKNRSLEPVRFQSPDAYNVDVYNMGVFRYGGRYIGLPAMYHATGKIPNYPNTDGFHLVQLVASRDLKTWRRLGDRQPFIGPSHIESGAYDLTQIISPSAPVVHGDELWFYYTGLKYRSNWDYEGTFPNGKTIPIPGRDGDVGAVCLAVLRRDGFVSLDAKDKSGSVTTRPLTVPAGRLHINVDARGGELRVEAIDGIGQTTAQSATIRGDRRSQEIVWERGSPPPAGQPVSLRFTLQNARLYSYWFAPAE